LPVKRGKFASGAKRNDANFQGWYCVPSKGQGLFLKVRDCRPVVAGGKKKVLGKRK